MKAICDFKKSFQEKFSDDMILDEEYQSFGNMGSFRLVYYYIPLNYNIIVANELRTFTITIEDAENAKNSLYRIEKFDNQLSEENIGRSLEILKNVLKNNEFALYLYVNNKLFKKDSNGLKRVKDIRELLNE
jgi:hypothetical protein